MSTVKTIILAVVCVAVGLGAGVLITSAILGVPLQGLLQVVQNRQPVSVSMYGTVVVNDGALLTVQDQQTGGRVTVPLAGARVHESTVRQLSTEELVPGVWITYQQTSPGGPYSIHMVPAPAQ